MEIKNYKTPQAEVIEVNVQNVLCQSAGVGVRYNEEELEPGIFGQTY